MAEATSEKPKGKKGKHDSGKIIKDPIHSPMRMRSECIQIIDTPQFQRLRYIKQLGSAYYVFPGASHKRFEHSLGVALLAEQMVKSLQSDLESGKYEDSELKTKKVRIEEDDVLCVTLAGLCHDLGHGPFSHTFEDAMKTLGETWKHEDASVQMFEHIMKSVHINNLEGFYPYDKNITFIKELIGGPKTTTTSKVWPYEGRGEEKSFLYEIVNNAWSGIDVDKWDYFARDSHHLGIQNTFDHRRYMQFARIVKCGDPPRFHICPRDKEAWDVYDLFNTRYMLARKCHCHTVTKAIELMIRDAIVAAGEVEGDAEKPAIYFKTAKGRLGIRDAVKDMEAYTKMNDGLYHQILYSEDDRLDKARTIIERLERRDIYKCIGQAFIEDYHFYEENEKSFEVELKELTSQDILLHVVRMSYGKAAVKIDDLDFWDSSNPDQAIKMKGKISKMLPQTFEDVMLHVYVTTPRPKKDVLRSYHQEFFKWCENKRLTPI